MKGIDLSKIERSKKRKPDGKKEKTNPFSFLEKEINLFGSQLNDKKKEGFYLELNILLEAGVNIKAALELISEEQVSLKDKQLFDYIKDSIVNGSTLSEAIKQTGKFSTYEYFSLQIGEESGQLTVVLEELANYYQKKIKQKRQIVGALTYPGIVMFTAFAAIFFMLNFIVPMFADVFKRFGGDLPFITKVIVQLSGFFKDYIYLILLITFGTGISLYSQKNTLWFRKNFSRLLLRLPVAGDIVRKVYLATFCHSMTLLIGSKVPLLRAITMVRQMIGFYPIEVSLDQIEKDILDGKFLYHSMSKFSIYPKRMISLVKVGEEVNQLESFFDKIAKQYNEEVEHQTSLLSSMLEPFLIIFLGLIVGVILIAMYLPLFQLSTHF